MAVYTVVVKHVLSRQDAESVGKYTHASGCEAPWTPVAKKYGEMLHKGPLVKRSPLYASETNSYISGVIYSFVYYRNRRLSGVFGAASRAFPGIATQLGFKIRGRSILESLENGIDVALGPKK